MNLFNNYIKYFKALFPLVVLLLVTYLFYFYFSPTTIVEYIGIDNAYILMYFFAFFGGLTTFNTVPYYSILLILANSGVDPVYLGLASALGVMTGDSFSYFVGRQGGSILSGSAKSLFDQVQRISFKYPKAFPLFCFLYGSISPFSNDVITLSSGVARIPFYKVMIPLALGNIIFNITLANLAVYAYPLVQSML